MSNVQNADQWNSGGSRWSTPRGSLNARSRGWDLIVGSSGAELGFGKFGTTGEVQPRLSQKVSPPRKWSYCKIVFGGLIGLLVLEFILGCLDSFLRIGANFNQQFAWFGNVWLGLVAFILCVTFRHNVWTVPKRRCLWERSFVCRRCGHVVEGHPPGGRESPSRI